MRANKHSLSRHLCIDAVMQRFIHFKFKNNMKIQELRIGNIVKYKKGHLAKIIGTHLIEGKEIIEVVGVDYSYINGTFELNNFYPVKLTEDWLIDNGFYAVEVDSGEYYYQNYRFRLNSNYAGFYYSRNLTVKYVHQLQNLYFALTGMELQVNVA